MDMEIYFEFAKQNPVAALTFIVGFIAIQLVQWFVGRQRTERTKLEWQNKRDKWEQDQLEKYNELLTTIADTKQKEAETLKEKLSDITNSNRRLEKEMADCQKRTDNTIAKNNEAWEAKYSALQHRYSELEIKYQAQYTELETELRQEINDLNRKVSKLEADVEEEQKKATEAQRLAQQYKENYARLEGRIEGKNSELDRADKEIKRQQELLIYYTKPPDPPPPRGDKVIKLPSENEESEKAEDESKKKVS